VRTHQQQGRQQPQHSPVDGNPAAAWEARAAEAPLHAQELRQHVAEFAAPSNSNRVSLQQCIYALSATANNRQPREHELTCCALLCCLCCCSWNEFSSGFTVGALSGVAWAYACTQFLPYYS
jgi:hypothetical protein